MKVGVWALAGRILAAVVATSLLTLKASGADAPRRLPVKAPAEANFDWTGWYAGGHLGYSSGTSKWSATENGAAVPSLHGTLDFFQSFNFFKGTGSYFAGFQFGYNYLIAPRLLLGAEADVSFPNSVAATETISSALIGQASYGEMALHSGTVRSRVGYAFDHWLLYGTGGMASTYDRLTRAQITGTPAGGSAVPGTVESALLWRLGWTAGAGVEVPLVSNWTVKLEYLFADFGRSSVSFPAAAQRFDSDLTSQSLRLGLNYKMGREVNQVDFWTKGPAPLNMDDFSFHGQTTYVHQYAFPFRAPYRGQNSLDSNAGRETWDATFYAGVRLWQGAELWINPEVNQGFGLSGTLGVAGFPSGEAYKVGAAYPYARLQRTFIRQTIDLGGESQKIESGINQFSGSQTANRLVITVGKFGVVDIFDTNKYAHDARSDFLNWSIIDTGTFDYAADAWGYSYGAAIEWYQGPWTLRTGLFDLSIVPNSTELDPRFAQFQWVGEIEHRHELWGQSGKVAVTGFLSRGRMGRFDDAVRLAQTVGGPADISAVRRYTSRSGVSVNGEQQITPELGVFARAGLASGNVEPYEFADIDRTIAAGFSLSGKLWGRAADTLGVAGALNGISESHQAYLDAGGLGILVGDGRLPSPGSEKILEAYYAISISSWRLTLDYQFIMNPAYNRDRGPVSVIGTRLRAQF